MDTGATDAVLAVVSFDAGGFRFAVEAAQVRGMVPEGEGGAGIAVEPLLGLPPEARPPRHRLDLAGGGCVEVSGPVGLDSLPAAAIFPLPPLVAARMALAGIRAVALMPPGPVLVVDLRALLP